MQVGGREEVIYCHTSGVLGGTVGWGSTPRVVFSTATAARATIVDNLNMEKERFGDEGRVRCEPREGSEEGKRVIPYWDYRLGVKKDNYKSANRQPSSKRCTCIEWYNGDNRQRVLTRALSLAYKDCASGLSNLELMTTRNR